MVDILYGVTMEEHGVRKIVSMKFHKTDQTANGVETAPSAGTAELASVGEN